MSATSTPTRTSRARHDRPPGGPDPVRLARAVAIAFLEVEAGCRPLAQLAPVLSQDLLVRLERRRRRRCERPTPKAVLSVGVSHRSADRVDVAVVVRGRTRVSALAIGLERQDTAWRVIELARPEHAHPSPRA